MERVSGNIVEFQMSSLTPATHYTVKVYAVRDLAKSAATTTEFTTGECFFFKFKVPVQEPDPCYFKLYIKVFFQ